MQTMQEEQLTQGEAPSDDAAEPSWRHPPVTLIWAVVGFAIFLSAVWTARNEAALVPDIALYTARFVKVAACFAIAWLFRNHIPSVERMIVVGGAFIVAHDVVYAVASVNVLYGIPAVAVTSGLLSGVGEACIIIVYAHLFSTYEPRLSAVGVPIAYLLNEAFYLSSLYVPSDILVIIRPLAKVAGIAILAWCLARKTQVNPTSREYPLQYGMSTKPDQQPPLRFLSSSQEWMLILAGTTLFPLLFGLIAQMCSNANTNSGLYDITNELVAIALITGLVVLTAKRGTKLTFESILFIAFPLFATGCLLLPALWYQNQPYAGIMVKCGYTVYQVLLWVLLARKSYEDLRHTYLYFGIFYGIFELTTAAARLIASNLYYTYALDIQFMSFLSLFSLWLIALYGLLFFAISRRWQKYGAQHSHAAPTPLAQTTAKPVDEPTFDAAGTTDDFAAKVDVFCQEFGLSQREHVVLIEAIHGYSMENIGKKLFISRETVKTHLRRIYQKTGVSGKQELIGYIDKYEPKNTPR